MVERWSWARTGLGLVAVVVGALAWSCNDEQKRPKRRRRRSDDEDDEALALRDSASHDSGAQSSSQTSNAAAVAQTMQAMAAARGYPMGLGNSAINPWTLPGSSSPSRRWQAAMSASEKRELDLMFRQQERFGGRTPTRPVVDVSRVKVRQQNRQQRREVVQSGAATSDVVPCTEDYVDPDIIAQELLAEEAAALAVRARSSQAVRGTTSQSAKKAKKKPRKKKAKAESNQVARHESVPNAELSDASDVEDDIEADDSVDADVEVAACADPHLDTEASNFPDTETTVAPQEGNMVEVEAEEDSLSECVAEQALFDTILKTENLSKVTDLCDGCLPEESLDTDDVCDAAVQTFGSKVAGTPTTEEPSSTGASSTRQGSEADLSEVVPVVADVAASSGSSTSSTNHSTLEANHSSLETHTAKGSRLPARRGRWADLTDDVDHELSAGDWSIDTFITSASSTQPAADAEEKPSTPVTASTSDRAASGTVTDAHSCNETSAASSKAMCPEEVVSDARKDDEDTLPWLTEDAADATLREAQLHSWVKVPSRGRGKRTSRS